MIRKIFIRRLLPLLMLLPASLQVNGQKDALYYQYMFNHFILNPAYSGVPGVMNMYMVDRYQWVGIPGAPNTIAFSITPPSGMNVSGSAVTYTPTGWGPLATMA